MCIYGDIRGFLVLQRMLDKKVHAKCTATMRKSRVLPAFLTKVRPVGSLPRAVFGMSVHPSQRERRVTLQPPLFLPFDPDFRRLQHFQGQAQDGLNRCNVRMANTSRSLCSLCVVHWNVIFDFGADRLFIASVWTWIRFHVFSSRMQAGARVPEDRGRYPSLRP